MKKALKQTKTRSKITIRRSDIPTEEQSDSILLDRHNSLRTAIIKQFDPKIAIAYTNHLYALLEVERELTLREGR